MNFSASNGYEKKNKGNGSYKSSNNPNGFRHKNNISTNILFLDIETTGLNCRVDYILEIGCIMTNQYFQYLDSCHLVIHQSDDVLSNMNYFAKKHHSIKDPKTKTSLIDDVKNSNTSLNDASVILVNFVRKHCGYQSVQLAGFSVHKDLNFIKNDMPSFDMHLHHSIYDVSSDMNMMYRRSKPIYYWIRKMSELPEGKKSHRAMNDALLSWRQAILLWDVLFNPTLQNGPPCINLYQNEIHLFLETKGQIPQTNRHIFPQPEPSSIQIPDQKESEDTSVEDKSPQEPHK